MPEPTYLLTVEREMSATPEALFRAWTEEFGRWFAVRETVRMQAIVGEPYFFQTQFEGARYSHYGRFLELVPDRLVKMTWMASATLGLETVVIVRFTPQSLGAHLALTHEGFPNEEPRDRHAEAWPKVLEHEDEILS